MNPIAESKEDSSGEKSGEKRGASVTGKTFGGSDETKKNGRRGRK